MENRYIIASSRPEGNALGNKLKGVFSALRLSKRFSREPLIHWPLNCWCGAHFSDLFDTKVKEISEEELNKIKESEDCAYGDVYQDYSNNSSKYLIFDTWRFVLLPGDVPENFAKVFPDNNGKVIDLEFERIPIKLRNEFLACVKQLTPIKSIKSKVDEFVRKHDFDNVVGLHVRRADAVLSTDGRCKVSTDDKFFERMNEILKDNPKTNFFMATDCDITREKFMKAFPEKIIFYPDENWDKSTKESTQHALIDMLLLSKTKIILGSFLSSFTEIAWWFGGCEAKVEIMGDENMKKESMSVHKSPSKRSFLSKSLKPVRTIFRNLNYRSKLFRFFLNKYIRYKTKNLNA